MDMMIEQFKTIFDRPEKVKKLREMILDLAVRGKLVEQDPNDEPASVLLERIKKEKERLIKEKRIKKEKPLAEISEEEKPFELPDGWKWTRLGDIGITQTGTTPSTKNEEYFNGDIPFIKPADISGNGIIYTNESLTELGLKNGRLIPKNSVMMVCIGGSIGKNYFTSMDCSCNQQINAITPLANVDSKFIHYTVSSRYFFNKVLEISTGSATPIINKSKWEQIILQFPPLEEQKRIVEKVDSLMSFCDKLEKALEKKVHYGELAAKSVFNAIGNVSTVEELEETIRFILLNFKDLSLGDNAVKELKSCILQLAVQGKLVPQDPNDEAAEVLLEKIREEKERLIKEKKIKKEKPLAEISEEEKPFELPKGWVWTRLNEITTYIQRGKSPKYSEKNTIPVVAQKCIQWSGFDIKKAKFIEPETIEKYAAERLLEVGDLLWNSTGLGTLGRINIYPGVEKYDVVVADSHVTVIRVLKEYIDYRYLFNWFAGPKVQGEIESKSSGSTKQMELSTTTVKAYIVPIPPLEEQKRIVEKVDSLMKLCDELEKKIQKQKDYSNRLIESILKSSF
ncbi:restriction endonuclease subunit S [Clostridium septicum]|uniref:restriction endonuclease subunit S n=1 Tax=Clostridium septicum TaxID=1504 RepID=UPI00272E3801|nr:restriction endonuclease subunit S [Clostridium septicum]WLF70974.1 restriction endonuclease subunit S [Clostridium septicum]